MSTCLDSVACAQGDTLGFCMEETLLVRCSQPAATSFGPSAERNVNRRLDALSALATLNR